MGVHRFAVATALATFCLLIAGGLVSTTESGLACPDWPLCNGQFIPQMRDGKQFEHTHRLVASFVGAMTFGLCALIWKHRRKDRLLKRLGVAAVALVVVQALLGALTVRLKLPPWVSSTHLATAMAFFSLAVSLAFITRQRLEGPARAGEQSPHLFRPVVWVAGLTYAQIVLGAVMRHTRSGLVCGFDFPWCLGAVWPLGAPAGVQIHMLHRAFGLLAAGGIFWLTWLVQRRGGTRWVKRLSVLASAGVVAQVTLGFLTVTSFRDFAIMTVHSTLGAAILGCLWCMAWLARPVPAAEPAGERAPEAAGAKVGLA
ncbi:MAG TPA: COX15/CtaA family protein [Myxococcales bacterium]|nr:COX15/CtaA family protein [Myxococcales bacterium]